MKRVNHKFCKWETSAHFGSRKSSQFYPAVACVGAAVALVDAVVFVLVFKEAQDLRCIHSKGSEADKRKPTNTSISYVHFF